MEKITKSSDTVLIDPNEPLILPNGTALVGRVEWFLYALCCLDYQNLPTPMSRIEEFANALITGEIPNVEPQSRAEQFFLAILDGNVSNLPQPQSRSEVLLDKLARGEFDLSDVEPIQSRYELLLAYLIKNGGIGNIDYVLYEFSEEMKTMYNTVEKPFKSLELSGNTKVNVLQESVEDDVIVPYQVDECQGTTLTGTKETGSLDNLVINGRTLVNSVLEDTSNSDYVSFDQDYEGQSFTINETNEGAIQNITLHGQTKYIDEDGDIHDSFVQILREGNLYKGTRDFNTTYWEFGAGAKPLEPFELDPNFKQATLTSNYQHLTTPTSKQGFMFDNPNKTWTISAMFKGSQDGQVIGITLDGTRMEYDKKPVINGQWTRITWTFQGSTTLQKFRFENKSLQGEIKVAQIMVTETDYAVDWKPSSVDGEYKELRLVSCEMPVLTTVGKNLLDRQTLKQGYINENGEFQSNNTDWASDYIKILPNTKYTYKVFTNINYGMRFSFFNESKSMIYRTNVISVSNGGYATCESPSDAHYVRVHSNNFNNIGFDTDISLVMGDTPLTLYEPYKSNILSTPSDLELRGIGEVQDTLNCLTGEVTERIGKVVLDGSEVWKPYRTMSDGSHNFVCNKIDNVAKSYGKIISNNLPVRTNVTSGVGLYLNNGSSKLELSFTDLSTIEEVKSYLNNNNATIQYQLATESIKTVDLSVVDQNNTKIDKMHVFNEVTHVNASSDELTPTVNIGKSVSYPTIIKPNTKYTVDLKRNDKSLTVNLGGTEVTFASGETRKVITTPSTLTNDKLSYYGMGQKCTDIMVLEGEVEGNVDYFTGMQSVANPIVKTYREIVNINNMTKDETITGSSGGVAVGVNRYASDFIKIDFDKIYINSKNSYYIFLYDESKKYIGRYPSSWSTNPYFEITQGYYFKIVFNTENGEDLTSYVYDKSTILSCNEDVVLRQVDDVKDQLYYGNKIKYFDEITFNGNESWKLWNNNPSDVIGCYVYSGEVGVTNVKPFGKTINDKLPNGQGGHMVSVEGFRYTNYFTFSIHKDKIGATDVNDIVTNEQLIKRWLRENNITVQYELETPVIEKINLLIVDQDNIAQTKLHTFNDTTHIMTNSDELTPIIKCDGKLEYPVVIKPSTQYTILANTSANGHALNNIAFDLGGAKVTNTFGTRKITVTTPSTLTDNSLTITGEGAKIGELMVLEGNESDILPYFEGMSSCKISNLYTVGKNIFDGNLEKGSLDVNTGKPSADNSFSRTVNFIRIYPNKEYRLRANGTVNGRVFYYDENKVYISTQLNENRLINIPSNAKYLKFRIGADILSNGQEIQLEEGSVATAYEQHKSSILSLPEEVVLRSLPNGVCDTFNTRTGEYIQRIGKCILDGSESQWTHASISPTNVFELPMTNMKRYIRVGHIICDTLPYSYTNLEVWNTYTGVSPLSARESIVLRNNNTDTIQDLKAWLSQNPTTICYELETPIVKTVDLNVVDQDGNTIPKIKSYNNVTHLEVTIPKQSLLPHISAEVATDNSKDMSSLTTKHQEISETQSAIQDNIQSQSDEIDTALMATTEIFESILE